MVTNGSALTLQDSCGGGGGGGGRRCAATWVSAAKSGSFCGAVPSLAGRGGASGAERRGRGKKEEEEVPGVCFTAGEEKRGRKEGRVDRRGGQ